MKFAACFVVWTLGLVGSALAVPNVLFIIVDDLNDWVGWMDGHPQAATPNMDALAARGVRFTNAHCAYALCNPSRTSMLSGMLPSTSGVFGNQQDWRVAAPLQGHKMLPEVFQEAGFDTFAAGKVFHANHGGPDGVLVGMHGGRQGFHLASAWTERYPSQDVQIPDLAIRTGQNWNGLNVWHWDWGPLPTTDAATVDGRVSDWARSKLQRERENPFFMAVGIYAPHGPWYCPQQYFDQFPLNKIKLNEVPADDLNDVPAVAKAHSKQRDVYHRINQSLELRKKAVQAYLAQIAFADAMVGRVLEAVDFSTTAVVLCSDHGLYLGEKQKWHKGLLWEEATRVPLTIHVPELTKADQVCAAPVSLVDLYPTFLELAGQPRQSGVDGRSLVPWLKNPKRPQSEPVLITMGGGDKASYAARSERWRFIRYHDGSEELYDHVADPNEWRNLADVEDYIPIKEQHERVFPAAFASAARPVAQITREGNALLVQKDDVLNGDDRPDLANADLRIEAFFALQSGDEHATLLSQGADQQGFSLFLDAGVPVLAVLSSTGVVSEVRSPTAIPTNADGTRHLSRIVAQIKKGQLRLQVDKQPVVKAPLAHPLAQPAQGLTVGRASALARQLNPKASGFAGELGTVQLAVVPRPAKAEPVKAAPKK